MGTVLGKISVETPRYVVLGKGEDYEIREYESHLVAEVSYDPAEMRSGKDGGFMILADYIGAVGKPSNVKAENKGGERDGECEKIAMTAPVITQESLKEGEPEKIAMTAPVITQERNKVVTMQFVLPSKYSAGSVPRPTDPRVSVKEIPTKRFGVITFSGVADDVLVEKKLGRLKNALQQVGYNITGDHILARYNPPWTLPFLRKNEIMLPVG
eukprot:c16224_g1_i1 orf=179-817(-)